MASFKLSVRKDWISHEGYHGIIMSYSHEATTKKISTGVTFDPQKFDFDNKQNLLLPKNSLDKIEKRDLAENQSKLTKAINRLSDCIKLCEIQHENPNAVRVKVLYLKKPEEQNQVLAEENKTDVNVQVVSQNVFYWYENEFLPAKESEIGAGINSYRSTLTHLKGCFPNEDLEFKDLNKKNLDKLKKHLTKEKKKGTTTHRQKGTTTHKHFNNLKIFINWVEEMDEDSNNIRIPKAYKKTKVKARYAPPIGLSFAQFIAFYELDLSNRPELKRTRDVFVFGVSIGGPRHGDLQKIGKHLQENYEALKDQGFSYFENKTGNAHMNITLNKFGKEILKEYNFKFPHVPSNFRMNENLKTIAELLHWDELKDIPNYNADGRVTRVDRVPLKKIFSSKFMRKTSISIDAALGVSVQIGMKRSGHTTYNSYKRYLDIDKGAMDKANAKWDKVFSKIRSTPSSEKKKSGEKVKVIHR